MTKKKSSKSSAENTIRNIRRNSRRQYPGEEKIRIVLEEGSTVFSSKAARQLREQEARETELYEQIGRLKMELEWLKKSCPVRLK